MPEPSQALGLGHVKVNPGSGVSASVSSSSRGWIREDPLEKEIATLSSFLAWKIPWTEEPGEFQSMGSHDSN